MQVVRALSQIASQIVRFVQLRAGPPHPNTPACSAKPIRPTRSSSVQSSQTQSNPIQFIPAPPPGPPTPPHFTSPFPPLPSPPHLIHGHAFFRPPHPSNLTPPHSSSSHLISAPYSVPSRPALPHRVFNPAMCHRIESAPIPPQPTPSSPSYQMGYGDALFTCGRLEEASLQYQEALILPSTQLSDRSRRAGFESHSNAT